MKSTLFTFQVRIVSDLDRQKNNYSSIFDEQAPEQAGLDSEHETSKQSQLESIQYLSSIPRHRKAVNEIVIGLVNIQEF